MKTCLRWVLLALLPVTFGVTTLNGQDAASVNWPLTSTTTLSAASTGDVIGASATGAGGLTVRSYQSANNGPLGVQMQRWWLDNVAWPVEDSHNSDRYIQFAVSPDGSVSFNATSLSMALAKQGTNDMWVAIAYDMNGDFTSPVFLETKLDLIRDNVAPGYQIEDYTIDVTVDPGEIFYVRVYPFTTAGGATRYLNIQDVWVTGTTEAGELEGDAASGLWPMTEANPTGLMTTGNVTGATAQADPAGNLVLRDYEGPIGPAGVAMQRWWLDGANWPVEGSHDPARYLEFRLGPSGAFNFNVTNISMALSSSGTNNMSVAVRYATNAQFLDAVTVFDGDVIRDTDGQGWTQNDFPLNITVEEGEFIYVRLLPYVRSGTVGSGRTFIVQNIQIDGLTLEDNGVPPDMEASANWPLTSATSVNGFPSGQVTTSPAEGVGGLVVRNYTDTPEGPLGVSMQRWWLNNEAWPIETAYNPGRYVQFAVTANEGHIFDASLIRLAIGSTGTNNFWAAIYYSTNTDFTDPQLLFDGDTTRDGYDVHTFPINVATSTGGTFYLRIFPYTNAGGAGRYLTLQDVWIEGETDAAMPVELVSFTGRADGTDALLRWSVASEQNNAGFTVERRVGDAFQAIGFVEGRGTVSEPGEYSFRVRDLVPGRHAFRLRQVDFDGTSAFSPIVEIATEVPGEYVLAPPYPNPFNPQASVQFAVAHSQQVTVALYDVLGRRISVLYSGAPTANEMQTVRVDGSTLTSGIYFVRLEGESFSAVRRVTLLK